MYIIAGLFNIIYTEFKELEIDIRKIFDEFDVDIHILNNPVAKLDVNVLGVYLEKVVSVKKDNRIGLKSGFRIPFHLIATFFNLYHRSKTVKELFSEFEKYSFTANNLTHYSFRIEKGFVYYEISVDNKFAERYPSAARQWSEMQYGMALQYAYSYTGRFIQPVEAYSIYDKKGKTDLLEEYLHCSVKFSRTKQTLVFDESILDFPVIVAKKEYFSLFENVMTHIEYRQNANNLSNVVRRYLMHSLTTSGLHLKMVADKFNMSERNLQRKLKAEGSSYQQILDNLRMELSKKYLIENIPLPEIAFLLGFESQSAFNKFFQKHFHISPGRFIENIL